MQCLAHSAASRDRNLLPHKIQEIKMERNPDLKLCRMNLNEISFTKGQLISKCLFGVLNSSKKRT